MTIPAPISITAYDLAQRFIGIKELPGEDKNNPFIMSMLTLDNSWPGNDEVAWCSAFVNYVAWLLRLPRSKSLAARSWLTVGTSVHVREAEPGFDIVILKRGGANQPGPEVLDAQGHVGFFAGWRLDGTNVETGIQVLGGNQGNAVSIAAFPDSQVLGVRRLKTV